VSISSTYYSGLLRQYYCDKKLQSQNVTREKLLEALLYKKFEHKMLMKLTPGLRIRDLDKLNLRMPEKYCLLQKMVKSDSKTIISNALPSLSLNPHDTLLID